MVVSPPATYAGAPEETTAAVEETKVEETKIEVTKKDKSKDKKKDKKTKKKGGCC